MAGTRTHKMLNTLPRRGGIPTHVSLNSAETFVVVSNYAGSFTMLSINEKDVLIDKETYYKKLRKGSQVVKERHDAGHIQSFLWLPNMDHLVEANLGSDKLLQLRSWTTSYGAGPLHMVLHSNGKIAYVVNELSNTVSVYEINNEDAKWSKKALQKVTTLSSDCGHNSSISADIHLSSNGKLLYTSNRGHYSIAFFMVETNGTLVSIGWGEPEESVLVASKFTISF
ncbi:unnamed protein product [Peronospora effusa]|nr:unnamed protein product [Peronospora effusa]